MNGPLASIVAALERALANDPVFFSLCTAAFLLLCMCGYAVAEHRPGRAWMWAALGVALFVFTLAMRPEDGARTDNDFSQTQTAGAADAGGQG